MRIKEITLAKHHSSHWADVNCLFIHFLNLLIGLFMLNWKKMFSLSFSDFDILDKLVQTYSLLVSHTYNQSSVTGLFIVIYLHLQLSNFSLACSLLCDPRTSPLDVIFSKPQRPTQSQFLHEGLSYPLAHVTIFLMPIGP